MQEDIIKRQDDAGGYYKGEVWCMNKLQKGGMVQEEGIIKEGMMQEEIIKW